MPIMESGMGFKSADLPKGGEPLPDGTYHIRVDKVLTKTAKLPATATPAQVMEFNAKEKWPYLEIQMIVQQPEEYLGRRVFDIATLKPGAQFKVRQIFDAAQFGDKEYTDEEILNGTLARDIEGIEALVVLTTEKEKVDSQTGQTYPVRNKVNKYLPVQ